VVLQEGQKEVACSITAVLLLRLLLLPLLMLRGPQGEAKLVRPGICGGTSHRRRREVYTRR
jgi:hypothetical protein